MTDTTFAPDTFDETNPLFDLYCLLSVKITLADRDAHNATQEFRTSRARANSKQYQHLKSVSLLAAGRYLGLSDALIALLKEAGDADSLAQAQQIEAARDGATPRWSEPRRA